jgi:hypothetical protein
MDWQPSAPWLAIEGCPCNGFFLWTGLTKKRLTQLTPEMRHTLSLRIIGVRAAGSEAWCTTEDGTETGPLVVRAVRPDTPDVERGQKAPD